MLFPRVVKATSATPGGLVETLARQVNYTEVMLWYFGCPRGIGNPCPSGRSWFTLVGSYVVLFCRSSYFDYWFNGYVWMKRNYFTSTTLHPQQNPLTQPQHYTRAVDVDGFEQVKYWLSFCVWVAMKNFLDKDGNQISMITMQLKCQRQLSSLTTDSAGD